MSDITHNEINMAGALPELPLPTLDDFLAAYSQQPIEVVEGVMIPMHPPGFEHTLIGHVLYDSIHDFLRTNRLGRVLMETPYLLDADERSDWVRGSRVPDISFIAADRLKAYRAEHKNKPSDPARLAPDMVIEIVSPGDSFDDINEKIADYLSHGVRLVVFVSAKPRTVRVYKPENPKGDVLTEYDTLIGSPVLEGWSVPVASIFDVLDE